MLVRWMTIIPSGFLLLGACGTAAQTPAAPAQPASAPAPSVSLPVPVMSGPLTLSSVPPALDAGPLGTWYVNGAISALGLLQDHPSAGDRTAIADISNAQIFVQKTAGFVRFYVQLGAYALPAIGQTYARQTNATSTMGRFFGAVPQAFLKLAPSDSFSIEAGKLPTLIGDEYTFSFENVNIVRGLLWSQEPAVSRGIQANIIAGPLGLSLSLNDGFYSGRYTWLSGSLSWTIDAANALVLAAGGNLRESSRNTLATPLDENNGSIYDLIYTYAKGPLLVSPYLQYSAVPQALAVGVRNAASLYGGAVLASYALSSNVTLGARAEYEIGSGSTLNHEATNLLYGPGSGAASFTLTPTYTRGHWFGRADMSALAIIHMTGGDGVGKGGENASQFRVLLEAGYIF